MTFAGVGVVGAGLIGTSVGLALRRAGVPVYLVDQDPARARAAAALGAGVALESLHEFTAVHGSAYGGLDHVTVAVSPGRTIMVLESLLRLDLEITISELTSAKTGVVQELETLGAVEDIARTRARSICGAHPMAGRERGGPGAARADLFDDAAWIVTPYATTEARAEADAVLLGRLVGGRPQLLTPDDHDAAVGVVSHVPQVVASALASLLDAAPSGAAEVAGGGFRDTTRLADSDPALWGPILAGNAPATARGLDRLIGLLGKVRDGLLAGSPAVAVAVMEQGRRMRASLPGKSGRAGPSWASVGVVIEDRPGELARLFAAAGSAGVNIEDLHIEHAPDHPAGHVTLYVSPESTNQLIDKLSSSGWAAHRSD